MKNIYSKYNNCSEDNRPIPEPEEMLFNNPNEQERGFFEVKSKVRVKNKKIKINQNINQKMRQHF